ncbi:hypothetical protein C2E23DRAFT_907929 [Lenzites betulinus]|nr:hypothetical protein C2E23DRAFT_907929 [Lenzites betulinus]
MSILRTGDYLFPHLFHHISYQSSAMPFTLPLPTIRNLRGAGRLTSSYQTSVDLATYTNPSTPPHPTGWTWCESMAVWLPDDLAVTSGIVFNGAPACTSCCHRGTSTRAPAARPHFLRRLSSKDYWRSGSTPVKERPISTEFFSVRASGVTFSQIRLREIYPEEPCCDGSTDHSRRYLF